MTKYLKHTLHRYSADLERIRYADTHLAEALTYLRKCEDSDKVIPLIAGIRRIRSLMDVVFESVLPKWPGEEEQGRKKNGNSRSPKKRRLR